MKFPELHSGPGGKAFLKLKDGESVRGVFRGNPHPFRQHWVDGRGVFCPGKSGNCPLCAQDEKSSFRFRLNFVTQENGAWVAKVFEQGWTVYDYLKSMNDSDYDLERTIVKITRRGTGTDTSYVIVPVPNANLSEKDAVAIGSVPLHELSPKGTASETEAEYVP